tara:strand:- start:165229 stop:166434 length:1206 start_codon:yes stop_codon:yes gene_type:complete
MLKKIDVDQVRIGMYIQKLCSTWDDSPFWRTSLMLEKQQHLHDLQASTVKEVWIDTDKGLDVIASQKIAASTPEVTQKATSNVPTAPRRTAFSDEMTEAKNICAKGKKAVTTMFQEARMGKALNTEQAAALVDEISASVMRNPDALIGLARLKNKDDYTYMHSVAVCALMIALAKKLRLDAPQIRDAGMAGLLHDIGKMAIPQEILDKPGKLTDAEFMIVKAHPTQGHEILLAGANVTEGALEVCLHHHERMDGTGYPHQLKGEQISLLARMGAVCDVYDAITSNRAYKAGWEPAESLRKMAEWSGPHFDPVIFQAFVKCLGIYPTGSLVKLKSGRVGVVTEQCEQSLLTPKVKVFFSLKSNTYITPEMIDLARADAHDSIHELGDAEKLGLKNVHTMWSA